MAKVTFIIYMHRNKINNKVYIGQTLNPKKRWEYNGVHYKGSPKFYNAIQKYGWDNFEHIILKENLTLEEANYFEKYYIEKYNSVNNGYNIRAGGENGSWPEDIRQKISKSNKETWAIKRKDEVYLKKHRENQKEKVGKKVICLNTGEVFATQIEASIWCGLKDSTPISRCCKKERLTAGKHPITKERLRWMFYEEKEENK